MTGETCRCCGGRIEYVESYDVLMGEAVTASWWRHVDSAILYAHEAAPAFGGGPMTGERCRHCGGAIEYVEEVAAYPDGQPYEHSWWWHVAPVPAWPAHEAAPAFGGGS